MIKVEVLQDDVWDRSDVVIAPIRIGESNIIGFYEDTDLFIQKKAGLGSYVVPYESYYSKKLKPGDAIYVENQPYTDGGWFGAVIFVIFDSEMLRAMILSRALETAFAKGKRRVLVPLAQNWLDSDVLGSLRIIKMGIAIADRNISEEDSTVSSQFDLTACLYPCVSSQDLWNQNLRSKLMQEDFLYR